VSGTNFYGMDTAQVSSLANQLNQQASAIESVASTINGLVSQMSEAWRGPDATQFSSEWTGTLKGALTNVQNAITGFANLATQNVQQQEQASAAGGSSS
jgi:uncharacterized protein YukE